MDAPELRPLRVTECLDVAIKIYLKHAATLLKLVAIVVVPVQVLGAVVLASTVPDPELLTPSLAPRPQEAALDPGELWTLIAGNLTVGVLAWIATAISTGACLKAVSDAYLGTEPEWRASLGFVRGRLGSILWVTFLHTFVATVALFLIIAPGVWLWTAWVVAVPALLIEGVRGRRALARSFRLVRKRWWPTFGAIFLGTLLVSIIAGMIGAVFAALLLTDISENLFLTIVVDTLANTIGGVLTTPFQAALVAVIYFDLRVRKEGFDLELLASRVGIPATR